MDRQQSLADWFSAPNSKLFAGNYSCMRMRKARSTAAHGTNGNRTQGCAFGRAGCEGDGRLHCDSKWRDRRLQLQAAVSLQAVEQAVADTAERAADPAKTSADGTLQQAVAHTRTCQSHTAPSRVQSRL